MDYATYQYDKPLTDFYLNTKKANNRLTYIDDLALLEVGVEQTEEIEDQSPNNYTYDAKGRIISDVKNGITSIQWTSYDKIKQVNYANKTIVYEYNPQHLRLTKSVLFPAPSANNSITTTYIYDGTGLLMATYDYYNVGSGWKYRLNELETYGAGRTGVYDLNEDLVSSPVTPDNNLSNLRFEITDHLGSVRAVVKGVKKTNGDADIVALTDYHEFGMAMRLRSFANYRYGYQGSEKESGVAGMYTTDFRMLDVRIGRWFMPDPIFDPGVSPYSSMDNNPIALNDVLGLSATGGIGNGINKADWSRSYDEAGVGGGGDAGASGGTLTPQGFGGSSIDPGMMLGILNNPLGNEGNAFTRENTPNPNKNKKSSFVNKQSVVSQTSDLSKSDQIKEEVINTITFEDGKDGAEDKLSNGTEGSSGINDVKMKPASAYDYSQEVIPGKFTDDWNYITRGGSWYKSGWRATQLFWRDFTAIDNRETVEASVLYIFIGGYGKILKEVYHPGGGGGIKDRILDAAGRKYFSNKVGKNPDVEVVNGQIRLIGTGPFKGKTYPTTLKSSDYLP